MQKYLKYFFRKFFAFLAPDATKIVCGISYSKQNTFRKSMFFPSRVTDVSIKWWGISVSKKYKVLVSADVDGNFQVVATNEDAYEKPGTVFVFKDKVHINRFKVKEASSHLATTFL